MSMIVLVLFLYSSPSIKPSSFSHQTVRLIYTPCRLFCIMVEAEICATLASNVIAAALLVSRRETYINMLYLVYIYIVDQAT